MFEAHEQLPIAEEYPETAAADVGVFNHGSAPSTCWGSNLRAPGSAEWPERCRPEFCSSPIPPHDQQPLEIASYLRVSNRECVLPPVRGKTPAVPPPLASNQKDLVTVPRDS